MMQIYIIILLMSTYFAEKCDLIGIFGIYV